MKLSPLAEIKRDELAEQRSLKQCSTGQDDLNKAVSWYLKVGFEDGFSAGYEFANQEKDARAEKLVQAIETINNLVDTDHMISINDNDEKEYWISDQDVQDIAEEALAEYRQGSKE